MASQDNGDGNDEVGEMGEDRGSSGVSQTDFGVIVMVVVPMIYISRRAG